jgi:aryl-alcohol dehydrogenase-like predicted oxidoreductase
VNFRGIALGCGNFGGVGSAPAFFGQGIKHDEAFAIMDRAWANGLHWFDTGDAYGGGSSEQWIGEWIRDRGVRPTITTKVFHSTTGDPNDVGLAPDRVRRQLEASLEKLGHVDLYLAHEPDPRTALADTLACFEALQDEGLIGAWGLSNYDVVDLNVAVGHGRPVLVQNSYSLLQREDDADVRPFCGEHGLAYVPFGPLGGGWLTGKYRRGEAYPEGSRMSQRPGPYERFASEAVFDGLEQLEAEAESRGVTMATLAFAWVLGRVDGAVCGPNTAAHLDPVLAARDLDLTPDDIERIGGFFT